MFDLNDQGLNRGVERWLDGWGAIFLRVYRVNMSFKMVKMAMANQQVRQNREDVSLPLPPHALPFTPHIPRFDSPQGCLLRSAPISAYHRQDRAP